MPDTSDGVPRSTPTSLPCSTRSSCRCSSPTSPVGTTGPGEARWARRSRRAPAYWLDEPSGAHRSGPASNVIVTGAANAVDVVSPPARQRARAKRAGRMASVTATVEPARFRMQKRDCGGSCGTRSTSLGRLKSPLPFGMPLANVDRRGGFHASTFVPARRDSGRPVPARLVPASRRLHARHRIHGRRRGCRAGRWQAGDPDGRRNQGAGGQPPRARAPGRFGGLRHGPAGAEPCHRQTAGADRAAHGHRRRPARRQLRRGTRPAAGREVRRPQLLGHVDLRPRHADRSLEHARRARRSRRRSGPSSKAARSSAWSTTKPRRTAW